MTSGWPGGLPPVAAARIARAAGSGGFSSFLSVPSAAAVAGAGLLPVGEVMGSTVVRLGWQGWGGCGVWGGRYGGGITSAPVIRGFQPYRDALNGGYRTALHRMTGEATALGADGVVGVRLHTAPLESRDVVEFTARGTAVRFGPSHQKLPRAFRTTLSGPDVTKLMDAGWMPASLLVEVVILVRHDDWNTQVQSRSWGNTEVQGYTELMSAGRHEAREQITRSAAALGDDGVLITSMRNRVWEQEFGENHRDHVVEFTAVGTGLARLAHGASPPPTLVLPLR
jgi:uncharacterized protein YbjQ (UPF0145 family)